jgi:hypothetical protein
MSLDAPDPQRMMNGASAIGVRFRQLSQLADERPET